MLLPLLSPLLSPLALAIMSVNAYDGPSLVLDFAGNYYAVQV